MAERAEVRSRAQERLEKIEDSGCCSMVGGQHKPVAVQGGGNMQMTQSLVDWRQAQSQLVQCGGMKPQAVHG